mgnify:FL=1|jgi:hypothetical protein
MKIITIKQFSNEAKANLYKHKFDEEDIQCIISNTIVSTLIPMGAGTFSLQILESDLERGIEIIHELDELYIDEE